MQIQRSPVQITPGQDNVSILARSLALHDPCGVRCTHQTIGTGNLVEWVRCCLFTQMVNQQNTDAVHRTWTPTKATRILPFLTMRNSDEKRNTLA